MWVLINTVLTQFQVLIILLFSGVIDFQEEALCLLCTLINFFPSSVHRHYESVSDYPFNFQMYGKSLTFDLLAIGI